MFRTRAIVSLTLAPLAALIIYLGGWVYFLIITAILLIGVTEFVKMMKPHGWSVSPLWLGTFVLLFLIDGYWPALGLGSVAVILTLFFTLLLTLWRYETAQTEQATADMFSTIAGALLLGWLGSHVLRLRLLDAGGQWVFIVVAIIWLSDTFAYVVGSQIGRHKLTPRLSPKKSVEGYIAGIILGVAGAALFKFLFLPDISWTATLTLGIILTLVIPAGDLCFSLLKRESGLKDAGRLFPGHGGVLDRFDTLLWGGAIAYYLIQYLFLG